jgi:hypothetical protein
MYVYLQIASIFTLGSKCPDMSFVYWCEGDTYLYNAKLGTGEFSVCDSAPAKIFQRTIRINSFGLYVHLEGKQRREFPENMPFPSKPGNSHKRTPPSQILPSSVIRPIQGGSKEYGNGKRKSVFIQEM